MSGLTGPRTAVRGNKIAATGMAIAFIATLLTKHVLSGSSTPWLMALGLVIGIAVGVPAARNVRMTGIPQMVALFNGVGGGAVALIAWIEYRHHFGGTFALKVEIPSLFAAIIGSGLVLGLEHRVRKALGDPARSADQAPRPGDRQRRAVRDLRGLGDRAGGGYALAGAVHPRDPARGGGAGQHGRAPDRGRGHAGRDLAAQCVHRALGRGHRPRAEQHGADRGRDDRRRVRLDPDQPWPRR